MLGVGEQGGTGPLVVIRVILFNASAPSPLIIAVSTFCCPQQKNALCVSEPDYSIKSDNSIKPPHKCVGNETLYKFRAQGLNESRDKVTFFQDTATYLKEASVVNVITIVTVMI